MHTRRQQFAGCGCSLLALAALVGVAAWIVGPLGPAIVGVTVLVVAAAFATYHIRRRRIASRFRAVHAAAGKDVLIVYSDSPHWGAYIEANWLPRWGERAVLFNRSRPWKGDQIEAHLWLAFAGSAEHTPVAIVVPAHGQPRVVRFWKAFRQRKHGDDSALRSAEEQLERLLNER